MSLSTAGRTSMARSIAAAASMMRSGPDRHLRGVAGESAVVGERSRVVAGVSLVGAGAAGVLAGGAEAGYMDDRRQRVLEQVGEPRAEGVEGGPDPPDAAVRTLDPRGAEV